MKWMNYIALLMIFAGTSACEKLLFSDAGNPSEKIYEYEYFSRINVHGVFNIELKSDSAFSIKVQSYDALIDSVIVRMESEALVLEDHNSFNWYPDYPRPTIVISFPRLDKQLYLDYPSYVFTTDSLEVSRFTLTALGKSGEFDLLLKTESFRFSTGTDNYASYRFRGRSEAIHLMPRGSSVVDASGLEATNAYVYNNSIGDCSVFVSNTLEAKLDTYGNILCYGNPGTVTLLEQSGEGRLIFED